MNSRTSSESHGVATSCLGHSIFQSCSTCCPAKAMECEQPSHQFIGAPSGQTPRAPEFLRLAQQNRDWDPASPTFDHCTWGGFVQRIKVDELHFSNASISTTFRNGRCKGEIVQTLTNKLLSGEARVEEIPALVGVQDPRGKVFIVSGNHRLFALKALADKLPKEERIQVEVNTLLISLSDMRLLLAAGCRLPAAGSRSPSLPAAWKLSPVMIAAAQP